MSRPLPGPNSRATCAASAGGLPDEYAVRKSDTSTKRSPHMIQAWPSHEESDRENRVRPLMSTSSPNTLVSPRESDPPTTYAVGTVSLATLHAYPALII